MTIMLTASTEWTEKVSQREISIKQAMDDDEYQRSMALLESEKEAAISLRS